MTEDRALAAIQAGAEATTIDIVTGPALGWAYRHISIDRRTRVTVVSRSLERRAYGQREVFRRCAAAVVAHVRRAASALPRDCRSRAAPRARRHGACHRSCARSGDSGSDDPGPPRPGHAPRPGVAS